MWELAGYTTLCFHSAVGCCDGYNCDTLRMFAAFCRSHTHTSAQLVWCACVITVQHVVTKSCRECWFKWFLSKHCPLFRFLHLAVSKGWTLCYSLPDSLLWHWKTISSVSASSVVLVSLIHNALLTRASDHEALEMKDQVGGTFLQIN